ncbi:hypothetical protein VPH35_001883 [Triticum aestivum]
MGNSSPGFSPLRRLAQHANHSLSIPHRIGTGSKSEVTMECQSGVSKAPPLAICDAQSDAESAVHTRPSAEIVFTTPQKLYSAPFCGSSCTPECDDDIRPAIGMTFTDLKAAKDFCTWRSIM